MTPAIRKAWGMAGVSSAAAIPVMIIMAITVAASASARARCSAGLPAAAPASATAAAGVVEACAAAWRLWRALRSSQVPRRRSVLCINLRKQLCDFLRGPRIRQRHLAAASDRIEALRHQHDEAHIVPQTARYPSGFGAGAEIDIGACRTDDRRTGILRHHQPAKWRFRLRDSIGSSPSIKNGVP